MAHAQIFNFFCLVPAPEHNTARLTISKKALYSFAENDNNAIAIHTSLHCRLSNGFAAICMALKLQADDNTPMASGIGTSSTWQHHVEAIAVPHLIDSGHCYVLQEADHLWLAFGCWPSSAMVQSWVFPISQLTVSQYVTMGRSESIAQPVHVIVVHNGRSWLPAVAGVLIRAIAVI
eukprot:scaffold97867_cov33-Prasinocladus_malaysianus.AAC.5